jgi:hypothetical protein
MWHFDYGGRGSHLESMTAVGGVNWRVDGATEQSEG